MNILVLGDIHGGLSTVKKVLWEISSIDIDLIIAVGDFASLRYRDPIAELENMSRIFDELNSVGVKVFYVWGNRDIMLFDRLLMMRDRIDKRRALEIVKYMLSLENLIELVRGRKIRISDNLQITSDNLLVDEKTIYVTHYIEGVVDRALIHIEGHVHYGQVKYPKYLNAGFVYRDDLHNAKPMEGMYCILNVDCLKPRVLDIEVKLLTNDIKAYECPIHFEEGIFYIPRWWKRCPVCYDFSRAKFTMYALYGDFFEEAFQHQEF